MAKWQVVVPSIIYMKAVQNSFAHWSKATAKGVIVFTSHAVQAPHVRRVVGKSPYLPPVYHIAGSVPFKSEELNKIRIRLYVTVLLPTQLHLFHSAKFIHSDHQNGRNKPMSSVDQGPMYNNDGLP